MATLLERWRKPERSISTIEDYAAALSEFVYAGNTYFANSGIQQTLSGEVSERAPTDLTSYAQQAYMGNGITFACMAVRMLVFSAVEFKHRQIRSSGPGDLFGNKDLAILERPWPGGTTQDLLMSMILDVDLVGNSYWTRIGDELVRLRPDWTNIVLQPRSFRGGTVGYQKVGYVYQEGGFASGSNPVPFLAEEVAHFAPLPDPLATYRGMSWLTPVIREMLNDNLMSKHQRRFFENGATPNLVIKMDPSIKFEMFERFKALFEKEHQGVYNAYKPLFLGGGADATAVGADLRQVDFKSIKGQGETRIAAAAGTPPVIVGLSEGLQGSSLNAGNYGQARRRFADGTMHPLWTNVSGCLQTLVPSPSASRLWPDSRGVPFLREDRKDAAEIEQVKATTIRQYVDAGFTPESAVLAANAEDASLLVHTGYVSVQLQPLGSKPDSGEPAPKETDEPEDEPEETP